MAEIIHAIGNFSWGHGGQMLQVAQIFLKNDTLPLTTFVHMITCREKGRRGMCYRVIFYLMISDVLFAKAKHYSFPPVGFMLYSQLKIPSSLGAIFFIRSTFSYNSSQLHKTNVVHKTKLMISHLKYFYYVRLTCIFIIIYLVSNP